jgi:hypothetical protein
LDPGSEIRDPERIKVKIRDKHPGSTTLVEVQCFNGIDSSESIPGVLKSLKIRALSPVLFRQGIGEHSAAFTEKFSIKIK